MYGVTPPGVGFIAKNTCFVPIFGTCNITVRHGRKDRDKHLPGHFSGTESFGESWLGQTTSSVLLRLLVYENNDR